jgi:hypothetical protein
MHQRTRQLLYGMLIHVLFAVAMSLRAWWDFTHPREWEYAGNDPHVYVWAVVLLWCFTLGGFAWLFAAVHINERKRHRKAKIDALLKRVRALMREKKFTEAEDCLNECKVLIRYREPRFSRQRNIRREQ